MSALSRALSLHNKEHFLLVCIALALFNIADKQKANVLNTSKDTSMGFAREH